MLTLDTNKVYSVSEADEIIKQAFKLGSVGNSKKLRYRNIIAAFDIETTSFVDDESQSDDYKDTVFYNYIKGTTIKISDLDITMYKDICPSGLRLSNKKGYAIDELYDECCRLFPYYFPDDVISPDNQLKLIFDTYNYNIPNDSDLNKRAIMYCWQFAIQGHVIFGRTWDEFLELIEKISEFTSLENRLLVYCHNLQFEFQWIRKFFHWHKVFAISPRKPIYAITDFGIEFRCSYILTNYSLAKLAEQLRMYEIEKLDTLDYDLYRSPITPMSWDEIRYCINDVLVVSAYIQECIIKEKSIANIPLTATGYCRRFCRNMCFYGEEKNKKKKGKKWRKYHEFIQSLTISGKDEYLQMHRAFMGGFTHPSSIASGRIFHDVDSIDFTSSYPFTELSECRFPMSVGKIIKLTSKEEFEHYLKYYACIFDVEFIGITSKIINENYISVSHCFESKGVIENNGRLFSAERIKTTITEIDYEIIQKVYDIKEMNVTNFRVYRRGYLPKDIILAIIKLYKDKTELKGVEGKEAEYLNGKALLNSIFGMMCTDICKPEIIYQEDKWDVGKLDYDKVIEKYNKSGNRFLFYPWGIYTCALARKNLFSGILTFGDDYLYSDTDSIKCTNLEKHMDYVNAYNENCKKKLQKMCEHYKIPYSDLEPVTIEGEKKPIGIWDIETKNNKYLTFKTIGAKRYMYTQYSKKSNKVELHITVAGVNKEAATPYLEEKYGEDVFTAFRKNLIIPAEYTGKLTHCYIDHEQKGVITDYLGNKYRYISYSGIYLEKTSFKFSIAPEYEEFLSKARTYK